MFRKIFFFVFALIAMVTVSSGTFHGAAHGIDLGGFSPPKFPDIGKIKDIAETVTTIEAILSNPSAFGLSMDDEDPITTSFDDCVLDCPYLDNYPLTPVCEEMKYFPLGTLPRSSDGSAMMMPGRYEEEIQTFCLHAGKHGPGRGDGYLFAPLKGSWEQIVRSILKNSINYPEIPQEDIQSLVWAVLARSKFSEMSKEMQAVARKVLSDDQIKTINGGALGIIPQELMEKVFSQLNVPPAVKTIMRANADIRYLVTQQGTSFEALEAVAILTGNPARDLYREVPEYRWSYHPNGYFINYLPDGYPQTVVKIVMPDSFNFVFNDAGKVESMEDEHARRLVIHEDAVTYICPDPKNPSETIQKSWQGFGAVYGADMSDFEKSHRKEVVRVCGEIEEVDSIVEIGKFGHALEILLNQLNESNSELGARARDLTKEAWMSAIISVKLANDNVPTRIGKKGPIGALTAARIQKGSGLKPFDWKSRWKPYNPSDDVAVPADRGRQRLGGRRPRPSLDPDWGSTGGLPKFDPQKNPKASKAMEGVEKFSGMMDKVGFILDPMGSVLDTVGFAIPKTIFDKGLKWVVNLWETSAGALSMDPPRDDYKIIAKPETFNLEYLVSPDDGPREKVDAANEMLKAFHDMASFMKAAWISLDRQGGAALHGDDHWAWEQAKATIYYQRQAGYAMYTTAAKIENYISVLRSLGVKDIIIKPEDFYKAQRKLMLNGLPSDEYNLAKQLGLSDSIIKAFVNRELNKDPNEASGSVIEAAENLSQALREYGWQLINLPDARLSN